MPSKSKIYRIKESEVMAFSKENSSSIKEKKESNLQIQIQWCDRFSIEAETLELDDLMDCPLQRVTLEKLGGKNFIPYKIQTQAWAEILKGSFLFLVSGTGSGKTLAILGGLIDQLLTKKETHCLIMYPMKALAQDQEERLREQCSKFDLTVQRYDSSISTEAKAKIRKKPGDILIITPDTLMGSILGTRNEAWYKYLTGPAIIWVDEFHAMSGTLGTTLCYLARILYLINPALRIFFTSATLANVEEIAALFPHQTTIIKGGSRHGNIKFHVGTTKDFLKVLEVVQYDKGQFLIFIENKRRIETVITSEELLSQQVDRYHADLPDDERHLILSKFTKKELKGLLCTSAVSLGIDLPSVNNIVLSGFPRSFSLLFQEIGRGTRDSKSNGKIFLLLDENKLIDSYYNTHLEELRTDIKAYKADPMIIDLLNDKILRAMVLFALKLGVNTKEQLSQIFKEAHEIGKLEQVLTWLLISGFITKNHDLYIYLKEYAHKYLFAFLATLRPGFPKFKIITVSQGAEIELASIKTEEIPYRACKGNYYTKGDRCYLVQEIDMDRREIRVEESEKHFSSKNLVSTEVTLINELKFQKIGDLEIRLADFKVQVKASALQNYKVLKNHTEALDKEQDPNKSQTTFELRFETRGVMLEFPSNQEFPLSPMVLYQLSKVMLQNAAVLINISEKEVDCFQNYEKKLLYFLDRSCPTGVSQQLFEHLERILEKTYRVLAACPCLKGCDKCAIPVESNYLMPNFDSKDIYRKTEMLTILRRILDENRAVK